MKRELFYFFTIVLFLNLASKAQYTNWQWAREASSQYNEKGWDVVYDKNSGNAYVAGSFEGGLNSVYGSAFTNTNTGKDGLIAKYSSSGNMLWAIKIGGNGSDEIKSIDCDPYGNIYVAGYYQDTADFDPGPSVSNLNNIGGSQDCFLAKYSSAGSLIWAVRYGGSNTDDVWKVFVDSNNVYLCGSYNSSATFYSTNTTTKTTIANQTQKNFFGAKYDQTGVIQWAVTGGSTKDDEGFDVVADKNKVYFTGYYERDFFLYNATGVLFQLLQVSLQDKADAFIAAYTQAGTLAWATNASSQDVDMGYGITQDNSNIYVTGSYKNGAINFPSLLPVITQNNSGGKDIFVACLSKAGGAYQWASAQNGSGNNDEEAYGIEVDTSGNIITTGYFKNILNFSSYGGPVLSSSGNEDIFMMGHSNTGNFLWAKKSGGSGSDLPHGISISNNDEIFLTGEFESGANFGSLNLSNKSGSNLFLAKTGCGTIANNTLPSSLSVCEGNSVSIAGSVPVGGAAGTYSYTWEQSANSVTWAPATGINTSQDYSVATSFTDTYFRRVVDAAQTCGGPSFSNFSFVQADQPSSISYAGKDTSICSSSFTLTGNTPVSGNGTWSLIQGNANILYPYNNTTKVTSLKAGATILRWTIKNGVCPASTDEIIITRNLPDAAKAGNNYETDLSSALLSANTPSNGSGKWSVIEGGAIIENSSDPNTKVNLMTPENNIFRWTVSNGICPSTSDDITIYKWALEIPNGFTPNDDGINDMFVITNIEKYTGVKFSVFNRWGGLVFYKEQYKNTWRGNNMNNESLADDTYYYTLEIPGKGNLCGYIILKQNK